MNRILYSILLVLSIITFPTLNIQAQMSGLHGSDSESRYGIHSGNQFRLSFFNDGTYGGRGNKLPVVAGEWPINSGHYYLVDGDIFVGAEVEDYTGNLRHIISENKSIDIGGSTGDKCGLDNHWCTFLPLPGFADPEGDRIAMAKGSSEWGDSWPAYWPDIADPSNSRYSPDGWAGSWNGYFGRDVFNADEESYYVIDDYKNNEFYFFPDTTDLNRGGLGIRIYARGFQWSRSAAEDVFFCHFDIENIGTYKHNKMVFSYKIGNNMGETDLGPDAGDDAGAYDKEDDLVYLYDSDNIGAGGWTPVGYFGATFLESPGNPFDGIDNDNDGKSGSGPTITEAMFEPKILNLNDQIVIINYNDFQRTVMIFSDVLSSIGKDTLKINYNGNTFKFWAGKLLEETANNLFDDNLNGLIDENDGVPDGFGDIHYLYLDYKYIDYLAGNGTDNLLIDERRDDGIDNDGDWDPLTDDTGADGLLSDNPNYPGPDQGEGDGIPTEGEPNFDKTDVDETDMLGLTSFWLYDWNNVRQDDDEQIWGLLTPGRFGSGVSLPANIELIFGSGYFPLYPDDHQRFSMGIICATGLQDLLQTRDFCSIAYKENYRLPQKPKVPSLRITSHGKEVILNWDDLAEKTPDPLLGFDFEGYKVFKHSYPPTTNEEPIKQFDLVNEFSGYSTIPYNGEYLWLGNNTGIQHSLIDTTNFIYGYDYYFAVTSYDHGDPDLEIAPSETSEGIFVDQSGNVLLNKNAVTFRPVDPFAGNYQVNTNIIKGNTYGKVNCDVVDTKLVLSKHTYNITFEDTLTELNFRTANSFSLIDKTSNDTVINRNNIFNQTESFFVLQGFRLTLQNTETGILEVDTANSGWNREGIPMFEVRPFSFQGQPVQPLAEDYEVIFGELGIDTSKVFYRGSTLLPEIPVNFTIHKLGTNHPVDFAFRERDTTLSGPGIFSFDLTRRRSDEVIFLLPDSSIASWELRFHISPFGTDTSLPRPGDVLTIKTTRPFLSEVVFEFTMPDIAVDVNEYGSNLPKSYSLSQNYPNPFNPGTNVIYSIPRTSFVTLKVYDILGREVKTLVNEVKPAGEYEIKFNANNLASGIYFYTISAGKFHQTKKMLLVK